MTNFTSVYCAVSLCEYYLLYILYTGFGSLLFLHVYVSIKEFFQRNTPCNKSHFIVPLFLLYCLVYT